MAAVIYAMRAVCFSLVFFTGLASPTQTCDAEDSACGIEEGPRAGGAMFQSSMGAAVSNAGAPLKGRVTTMLAEVASLQGRVGVLLSDVGVEAELHQRSAKAASISKLSKRILNTTALYARYKELLQTQKYEEGALKEDISTLEADCSDLRSKILMLENQVQDGASLFASFAYNPTSMASRVEAVEKDVEGFRTRVSSLEQVIAGLQTKASKKASLLGVGVESESQLGPLSSRLSSLETEVASLEQRADHMESVVQGGSGALGEAVLQADAALVKPHSHQKYASLLESSEGTIKERTAALEQSVADLTSKLSMLENQVSGKTSGDDGASFMQVQASKGTDLYGRIKSLEESVDSLRTRTSNLEHVVEG